MSKLKIVLSEHNGGGDLHKIGSNKFMGGGVCGVGKGVFCSFMHFLKSQNATPLKFSGFFLSQVTACL